MLFMLTLIHSTIVVIMATYWWNGVNLRCSTASVRNRLAARTGSRSSMRLISCPKEGFKRSKSLKKSHCRV